MSSSFFFAQLPPSRHGIENEIRLSFWRMGYGEMWFTCTKEQSPVELTGEWHGKTFSVEWEPQNYLLLKMQEPDQELLGAFVSVLKHPALAAYRNGGGSVVVEWRAKDTDTRFKELETQGVGDLERLDK